MAESQALMSLGITVTFTGLTAELVDVNKDGDTNDIADISHQESPDKYREFKPGMTDPGVVTLTTNFVAAQAIDPQAKEDLVITIPTDTGTLTMTCKACMQSMNSLEGPLGDKIGSEVSFKLSGKPVWATSP